MRKCPVARIHGCFEESLAHVLLEDILLVKVWTGESLDDELVAHHELLFDFARVEDKCIVLRVIE
jgi:hypothetical protein